MACAVAATAVLIGASPSAADPPPPPSYQDAVQQAFAIIRDATPGDTAAASRAESVLVAGTGQTQPEIVADLVARPPLYEDARQRLQALIAALATPAGTSDPTLAQQRLHDVLAMHRYDPLHQPPTIVDRVLQWLRDRLNDFLGRFSGSGRGGGAPIPLWALYVIGLAVVVALATYVFLASRGTFGSAADVPGAGRPRAPADYFAQADRLAAAQDRVGAIRALCAGVAATLSGERTWEGSPLTVREIFRAAPDFAGLRPLLLPFEAAVYGGRAVDQATYERAALVAAPFRRPVEAAA
ncbi:MAG TPA: hypothetical protein VJT78_01430 [Candidatus Dormibacteraeota bacterium]|nr:hypothetical protein [Candidatus Dormibacteraeota bacterium]